MDFAQCAVAIMAGDVDVVRACVARRPAMMREAMPDGRTLLSIAFAAPSSQVLYALLDAMADELKNPTARANVEVLREAVEKRVDATLVDELLRRGASWVTRGSVEYPSALSFILTEKCTELLERADYVTLRAYSGCSWAMEVAVRDGILAGDASIVRCVADWCAKDCAADVAVSAMANVCAALFTRHLHALEVFARDYDEKYAAIAGAFIANTLARMQYNASSERQRAAINSLLCSVEKDVSATSPRLHVFRLCVGRKNERMAREALGALSQWRHGLGDCALCTVQNRALFELAAVMRDTFNVACTCNKRLGSMKDAWIHSARKLVSANLSVQDVFSPSALKFGAAELLQAPPPGAKSVLHELCAVGSVYAASRVAQFMADASYNNAYASSANAWLTPMVCAVSRRDAELWRVLDGLAVLALEKAANSDDALAAVASYVIARVLMDDVDALMIDTVLSSVLMARVSAPRGSEALRATVALSIVGSMRMCSRPDTDGVVHRNNMPCAPCTMAYHERIAVKNVRVFSALQRAGITLRMPRDLSGFCSAHVTAFLLSDQVDDEALGELDTEHVSRYVWRHGLSDIATKKGARKRALGANGGALDTTAKRRRVCSTVRDALLHFAANVPRSHGAEEVRDWVSHVVQQVEEIIENK